MNKNLFKLQLKSCFFSYKLIIILLISMFLILLEFKTTNNWKIMNENNFLHYTILFDGISFTGSIYLLLLPAISSFFGGTLYSSEKSSHRQHLLNIRLPRSVVLKTTLLSSFLLGGLASIFPILLSLIVACIFLPKMDFIIPSPYHSGIFSNNFWGYNIYSKNQILMILIILLILFVFGGLMSTLATTISFYSNIKYIETLLPFFITFIWYLISSLIGFPEWGHLVFLNFPATEGFRHTLLYLIIYYFILVLFTFLLGIREVKSDRINK